MNFKVFERRKVTELNDARCIKKLPILILEDMPTDTKLLKRELHKEKIPFSSKIVERREDFLKGLKDFMEAGKARLKRHSLRDTTQSQVKDLREENSCLKELVADLSLDNSILKEASGGNF